MNLADASMPLVWLVVLSFVFLECAVIIGLFLPGDSMLITAGMVLASDSNRPHAQLTALSIGAMVAAVAGNQVGYLIGARTGDRLVARKNGKYLNARNLARVSSMLHRHGFKAVLVARWIPWIRTLCPMVAGAAGMNRRVFTVASTLGAIAWAPVLLLIGFYAGTYLERIPWLFPAALIGMITALVVGTVLGLLHYRQEMRREPETQKPAAATR